jgi:hypothetical protein
MGVILRHFLRLTSPEMRSVFKASGTESHQRKRELRILAPADDEVELIRKAQLYLNPFRAAFAGRDLVVTEVVNIPRRNPEGFGGLD